MRPTMRHQIGRMLTDADRTLATQQGPTSAATLYLAVIAHVLAGQAAIPGAVPLQAEASPTQVPPSLRVRLAELDALVARVERDD